MNLLDVIASGYRPEQVIAHLKNQHTGSETYAGERIETGKGVQGIYKAVVLAYYGRAELKSLGGKHAWIADKLNGGAG